MMGHCQMKYIGDAVTDNAKEKSQLDHTALKIYEAMKAVTKK